MGRQRHPALQQLAGVKVASRKVFLSDGLN